MLMPQPTRARTPNIKLLSCLEWTKGLFTRYDSDRTPKNGLRTAENVILSQNGTVGPRPGLKLYGTQPSGTVLGQIYEYVYMSGSTPMTGLICMQVIGGVGVVTINTDGGAWTQVTGKTYSSTAKAHFEQVYGKVVITNGVDTLSYMDVQTSTITALTALTQPTGVSAVATGISGSNITLRYRVSAVNVGETAASVAVTVGVTKLRELWNGTTEFVTFTWNRVTNAQRYNIYVGDTAGFEYFLDSVADIGSGSTQTYVDAGSIAETTTRVASVSDSTAGPKTTRVTNVKGQPYMVGDADNPGRIWFGGSGASALDFSSFNGGGWVEPNKGGKDLPVAIRPFRDGKGNPMAVCFSKGTNGAGKRYLLQPSSTTVGTTVITYMAVQEDNGQDGTDSPDGVVMLNDAAWYPSRSGFKTSNTKANIQNIISTQGISDNISTDVTNLSAKYMDACVGLAYDQCIYWSLPYASTTNNQIWVLDLRQNGAWMRPWNVNVDWMVLYAENSTGKTKFLVLSNNKIYEFDPNTATNDDGTLFQTTIGSGDIKFDDNGAIWGSVIDVTFVFLKPQGNIGLSVNVNTEDGLVPFTDTMTASASQSVSAWGRFGWSMGGWGQMLNNLISVSSSKTRRQWTIEVGEECNSLTWGVNTVDAGVSYQLAEVIVRYVPIGYREIDNA